MFITDSSKRGQFFSLIHRESKLSLILLWNAIKSLMQKDHDPWINMTLHYTSTNILGWWSLQISTSNSLNHHFQSPSLIILSPLISSLLCNLNSSSSHWNSPLHQCLRLGSANLILLDDCVRGRRTIPYSNTKIWTKSSMPRKGFRRLTEPSYQPCQARP